MKSLNPKVNQILANLRDYHTPPPISWWPPALGWWLLMILGILAIGIGLRLWIRRRQRRAASRFACIELARLRSTFINNGDTKTFLQSLSKLLRRFVLSKFSKATVAGLIGSRWLQFLDDHGGQGRFQTKPGNLLHDMPYAATADTISETSALELADLIEDWIHCNQDK